MGEDKPKNALDEFWEKLGDKEKKHVRSYRPSPRNLQITKKSKNTNGGAGANSRKRRG